MDNSRKIAIFRERFFGRQDIYGRMRKVSNADGQKRTLYHPVCNNFFTDVCHIKNRTEISCNDCLHQLWDPVSDHNVVQHITGYYTHNYFPVIHEEMIRFGAIDFDVKPDKEEEGYDFFEVQKFCRILRVQGLAYGIARSTSAGYHVYMFFREAYPAARFRAVMSRLFEGAGFDRYVKEHIKPAYPEIFPKQDYVGKGLFGNGITPPMIEPMMIKGRKCWVDAEDRVIGQEFEDGIQVINAQWEYLEKIPWCNPEAFDRIIDQYNLKIPNTESLRNQNINAGYSSLYGGQKNDRFHGHIEKVMHRCDAFKDLVLRIQRGHDPSHAEGFALLHLAINTRDGKDWFLVNVPTWGRNPRDLKQIEYSINHKYFPHTCEKLKRDGICSKNGFCPGTEARTKTKYGSNIDTSNAENEGSHNPIRLAYDSGGDLLHCLATEAGALTGSTEEMRSKIAEIALRSQNLGLSERQSIQRLIGQHKSDSITHSEIKAAFQEAAQKHAENEFEKIRSEDRVFEAEANLYRKIADQGKYGFARIERIKGDIREVPVCDIDIQVQLIEHFFEDAVEINAFFSGYVEGPCGRKDFLISSTDWNDDSKFASFFSSRMAPHYNPTRASIPYARQAAMAWSRIQGVQTRKVYTAPGYYGDKFLMPSVEVDKHGVRPNLEARIELSGNDATRHLDFSIESREQVLMTLRHLIEEALFAWPEQWTFLAFSHALMAVFYNLFSWNLRATLFLAGGSGRGKSELAKATQFFFGVCSSPPNFSSTKRYCEEAMNASRDCSLLIDDYKAIDQTQKDIALSLIQYGYDGSSAGKLNRDSSMRKSRSNRCSLIMTGEDFITGHSSAVCRAIIVNTERFDHTVTSHNFSRVQEMKKHYRAVTPHFISWLMNKSGEEVEAERKEIFEEFSTICRGHDNGSRLAHNFAANHTVWVFWTAFLNDIGAATIDEVTTLNDKHLHIARSTLASMLNHSREEKGSHVFVKGLRELIETGHGVIVGAEGLSDHPRRQVVGRLVNQNPAVIYVHPETALKAVKDLLGPSANHLSVRAVAKQLRDDGFMPEQHGPKKTVKQRFPSPGDRVETMWPLLRDRLELNEHAEEFFVKLNTEHRSITSKKFSR